MPLSCVWILCVREDSFPGNIMPFRGFLCRLCRLPENILDVRLEIPGDLKSKDQRRVVFLLLNRKDRLAGDTHRFCEVFLGQVMHRSEDLELVLHIPRAPMPVCKMHLNGP
jgi:hypothetical protein